ncbi:hypothetical protein OCF15_29100 [Bacillus cereus]|nr:hypothetical protein [Bacillus cereus]
MYYLEKIRDLILVIDVARRLLDLKEIDYSIESLFVVVVYAEHLLERETDTIICFVGPFVQSSILYRIVSDPAGVWIVFL